MTAPAVSTFDDMVAQLVGAGFDRATAEREVRRQYPQLVKRLVLADEKADNVREKEEQAYIAKLFRGFGCKVYNLSQPRATKQTPGLPDLWVVHRAQRAAWWFEVKRSNGGRISDAQREFAEECQSARVAHYVGDRQLAARVLVHWGLARVGDGPCGIVPFHDAR